MANNLVFEKKTQNFVAYQQAQIGIAGNFFKIVDSTNTSAPPTISLIKNGIVIGNMSGFSIGDYVKDIDFDAVIIKNGAVEQNLTYMICSGGAGSDRTVGSLSVTGGVIDSITNIIAVDEQPMSYGASFKSNSFLLANTAETVFSAAANTNGAIVYSVDIDSSSSVQYNVVCLAKNTGPVSVLDGDVILAAKSVINGGFIAKVGKIDREILLPAGIGLYFIASANESTAAVFRSVLYKLL